MIYDRTTLLFSLCLCNYRKDKRERGRVEEKDREKCWHDPACIEKRLTVGSLG